MSFPRPRPDRRTLLLGAGAGALGALAACSAPQRPPAPTTATEPLDAVRADGPRQAGIADPPIAQRHCDLSIWDTQGDARQLLKRWSELIAALATGAAPALAGLAPSALTVTVGIGPRLVAAVDPKLPGAQDLPTFANERLKHRGGDLMLQVCGSDPLVVSLAVGELSRVGALRPRWRQTAFRGASRPDGAARNMLGFMDGIVVPRGDRELDREVWLDGPERVRGGTIAVVRRMRLDANAFLALPVAEQERVFGRRRDSAEPLSGGGPDAEVDLGAKTADGQYRVPADSHVRRAHPLTSGSGVMLRRSYSFDDGPDDRGLLFISFQRELRTFVATQHRLDEGDRLMSFSTTTASGTFLVLPGLPLDRFFS
ncbi:Dyp-type peroxidase [Allokutzneria sp. A3M-2-11 16]|uniref:Dyp-type peroxidase n=1 Tax=Allokutzneria sp. A3M-2-11 16 TaxID=2962043 RepID=UPI0020B6C410|nr:Dyp-type peroxidase [Allokutzneria sp. A3M-2-11 16]MCP3805226.1 Dyp-type peroxidase [Allokutzneria sp. A3M-2-11 16]